MYVLRAFSCANLSRIRLEMPCFFISASLTLSNNRNTRVFGSVAVAELPLAPSLSSWSEDPTLSAGGPALAALELASCFRSPMVVRASCRRIALTITRLVRFAVGCAVAITRVSIGCCLRFRRMRIRAPLAAAGGWPLGLVGAAAPVEAAPALGMASRLPSPPTDPESAAVGVALAPVHLCARCPGILGRKRRCRGIGASILGETRAHRLGLGD